jgi:hypothetical protein
MTAEEDSPIVSERVSWDTAKSSRHLRMVAPGLLERIISPAILLAKTSLRLGDTDVERLSSLYSFLKTWHIKL